MLTQRTQHMEYAIRDVVIPAMKLEKQGHTILKLNIGDPCKYDFDAPEYAKQAYINAIKQGKSFYGCSNGITEAKKAIIQREKTINDVTANEDQILINSGVSETINFLCGSLIEQGKEMLIPRPSYPQYLSFPNLFGGKAIEYKCDFNDQWNPDLKDIKEKINSNTAALAVINPNNPTGAIYSKETLEGLAEIAADKKIPLISDEIYDEITFTDYNCFTKIALDRGASIVQMNGMSKNFFAPGWRIGYAIYHNCPEILNSCSAQARTRLCSNTPAQYAMAASLNGSRDFLKENKQKLSRRMDVVGRKCKEYGLAHVKPKGAFYDFIKINTENDKQWVLDLLQEKHVLTVFGSGFGEQGKGFIRIVTLPQEEVLEEAFDRIGEFIQGK